jgi:translation initiation factor 2 alpha subunit (eIF-2alpha)
MATKDIVAHIMHVDHGQKLVDVSKKLLVDERTNGSEKEGEKFSKPLANTNFGLL